MARNLSRILSRLHKDMIFESPSSLSSSIFAAYLSSIPGRPIRGDLRTRDPSEDQFLRNLNFGDKDDGREHEKPHPNRPLRGERKTAPPRNERRPVGAADDIFLDLDEVSGKPDKSRRSSFDRVPKGGEHLMDMNGKEKGSHDLMNTNGQEKRSHRPGSSLFEKLNLGKDVGGGPRIEDGSHRPDGSLFEKLDLGKDVGGDPNMEGAQQTSSAESPKTETVVSESAAPNADEIFRKMKETGLIPNAVAMLDGLCKDGLVQEAMKLFGLMREKGTIPEVVIYTAVVEGFCKAAKFDDAKRIFRKMQRNGIVPNAFSYGVIIRGLCKGKRLEDSVEFCMEMLNAGHALNPATFTGLVDELCKEKGKEEAESFVRQLQERGFPTDGKPIREHMDKKGPFSPMVWEAIFGKKGSQRLF